MKNEKTEKIDQTQVLKPQPINPARQVAGFTGQGLAALIGITLVTPFRATELVVGFAGELFHSVGDLAHLTGGGLDWGANQVGKAGDYVGGKAHEVHGAVKSWRTGQPDTAAMAYKAGHRVLRQHRDECAKAGLKAILRPSVEAFNAVKAEAAELRMANRLKAGAEKGLGVLAAVDKKVMAGFTAIEKKLGGKPEVKPAIALSGETRHCDLCGKDIAAEKMRYHRGACTNAQKAKKHNPPATGSVLDPPPATA